MINDAQVNNITKHNAKISNNSIKKDIVLNDPMSQAPVLNFSPTAEATDENIQKLEQFVAKNDAELRALPPLEYEYRYMPNLVNGKINKKALLATAYKEMGAKEYSVKEFENKYLIDDTYTAEPLDINKDGKIDIAEYGANILAADVLSKGTTDPTKVDGTINSRGFNAILDYSKKANAAAASKLYTSLYNTHGLANKDNNLTQYS